MFEIAYVVCLLALLALPLLAQWRWGVLPALMVTIAELIAVFLVAFSLIPEPPPPRPMPDTGKLEHMMKGHADGIAHALAWLTLWAIPSLAVLLGGVLSLVWSAVATIRRPRGRPGAQAAQPSGPA